MPEPIETLYVEIEADASKLLEGTQKGISQVEGMFSKLKFPSIDVSSITEKFGGIGNLIEGVKGKFSSLGNVGGRLRGLGGKVGELTGKMKGLNAAGGSTLNTIMSFAKGRAPIAAVTGSVKGLLVALGPVGAVAAVAIGAITMTIGKLIKRINEGTAAFRNMFHPDTLQKFGVATNVLFENFEVQFATLLGSAEEARDRIEEYAAFGATTPFNLPEIVKAGKLLQTFGGEVLATGDNLTMVGDMASSAGAGFSEIAMWVGRAYTAMQSGRPFGEAAARLQELGLLSGENRKALEDLQKAGASSSEQFEKFQEIMGQFTGMMDAQSRTLGGMRSNLEDYEEQIALVGGQPIFDEEKRALSEYLAFLERGSPFEEAAGKMMVLRQALTEGDDITFERTLIQLQEMGFITDETRMKMQELRDMGADAGEILSVEGLEDKLTEASDSIDRFKKSLASGQEIPFRQSLAAMERLGVITAETRGELERLKEEGATAEELLEVSGLEGNKEIISDIAQAIGMARASFNRFFNQWKETFLNNLPLDQFRDLFRTISEIVDNFNILREISGGLTFPEMIVEELTKVLNFVQLIAEGIVKLSITINQISAVIQAMSTGIKVFADTFVSTILALSDFNLMDLLTGKFDVVAFASQVGQATQAAFAEATSAAGESLLESNRVMEEAANRRNAYVMGIEAETEALETNKEVLNEEALAHMEEMAALQARTEGFTDEFLEIQRQAAKDQEKAAQDSAERMNKIAADSAKKRQSLAKKNNQALKDLEEDVASKREAITSGADEEIKKQREENQREQKQATEDHQREMERMQERYLMDLTDAVKNRDARAIVDLRAKHAQETSESQESFDTTQSRQEEDNSRQEAETLANKDKELADLQTFEIQKRAELESQHTEAMAQLDVQMQDQLIREQEAAQQRQVQADNAAQKRLEKIAESLAKDNIVTEEGAKKILDTLNDMFGIGGNVDELMEDFASRRRMKMEVKIEMERVFLEPAETAGRSAESQRLAAMAEMFGGGGATQGFQHGGIMIARKPTLVSVAEGGVAEVFSAAPLSSLPQLQSRGGNNNGSRDELRMLLEVSGSAPPGLDNPQVDQIADTLVSAMRDAGWLAERTERET